MYLLLLVQRGAVGAGEDGGVEQDAPAGHGDASESIFEPAYHPGQFTALYGAYARIMVPISPGALR